MFWLKSRRPAEASSNLETTAPCAPWWRPPGCSAQPLSMPNHPHQKRRHGESRAAPAHEPHGAPDVFRFRRPAVAESRSLTDHTAVGVAAADTQAERPGEARLRPAGVRALGER